MAGLSQRFKFSSNRNKKKKNPTGSRLSLSILSNSFSPPRIFPMLCVYWFVEFSCLQVLDVKLSQNYQQHYIHSKFTLFNSLLI